MCPFVYKGMFSSSASEACMSNGERYLLTSVTLSSLILSSKSEIGCGVLNTGIMGVHEEEV